LQLRGPQQQQLQAQMAEEAINQQIIEETEAELGAINKSLHTVHEIFKDLASMVSQQQEQVCILHT
jgi:t-SNARE complex subunit (syntaxin)